MTFYYLWFFLCIGQCDFLKMVCTGFLHPDWFLFLPQLWSCLLFSLCFPVWLFGWLGLTLFCSLPFRFSHLFQSLLLPSFSAPLRKGTWLQTSSPFNWICMKEPILYDGMDVTSALLPFVFPCIFHLSIRYIFICFLLRFFPLFFSPLAKDVFEFAFCSLAFCLISEFDAWVQLLQSFVSFYIDVAFYSTFFVYLNLFFPLSLRFIVQMRRAHGTPKAGGRTSVRSDDFKSFSIWSWWYPIIATWRRFLLG